MNTYVQILMPEKATVFSDSVYPIYGIIRTDANNASFIELSATRRQTVCKSVQLFVNNIGEILTLGDALKRLGKGANPKSVRAKFKKLSPFTEVDIEKVLGRKPEPMTKKETGRIQLPCPVAAFDVADNRVNADAVLLESAVLLDQYAVKQMSSNKDVKVYTYESVDYNVKPPAVWWYYLPSMEGYIETASLNVDEKKVINKITLQRNIWKS